MSEVKALAGQAAATQGVDVNPADAVMSEEDIAEAAAARDFAAKANCAELLSPAPIDIVADELARICRSQWVRVPGSHHGFGLHAFPPSPVIGGRRARTATLLKPPWPRWAYGAVGQAAQARMKEGDGTEAPHLSYGCPVAASRAIDLAKVSLLVEEVR